jgi:hypothetical protein
MRTETECTHRNVVSLNNKRKNSSILISKTFNDCITIIKSEPHLACVGQKCYFLLYSSVVSVFCFFFTFFLKTKMLQSLAYSSHFVPQGMWPCSPASLAGAYIFLPCTCKLLRSLKINQMCTGLNCTLTSSILFCLVHFLHFSHKFFCPLMLFRNL